MVIMFDILERSKSSWFTRFIAKLEDIEEVDDEAIVEFEAAIVGFWTAAAVDIFTKSLLAPFFHFHLAEFLVASYPISLRGDVEDVSLRLVQKMRQRLKTKQRLKNSDDQNDSGLALHQKHYYSFKGVLVVKRIVLLNSKSSWLARNSVRATEQNSLHFED